jgi:hypothetical protein
MQSHKYHCLSCEAKWKAAPRWRPRATISFPLALLAGFLLFIAIDHLSGQWSLNSSSSGMMDILKDPALAGKLMQAQSDPSVLKTLTPKQRQKVMSLKNAIFNSKDAGALELVTQMLGDSALAEKVMRARGNPAALKSLSAPEKQKLKEIKNSLSPSQVEGLKAQYG